MKLKLKINSSLKAQTTKEIKAIVEENLTQAKWDYNTIEINPKSKIQTLKKAISEMKLVQHVSDDCLQGDYGVTSGKYDAGLTVYLDHSSDKSPNFFIDSDGAVLVNIEKLLAKFSDNIHKRYTKQLNEKFDGDFQELCEHLGILQKVNGDNSYNYSADFSRTMNIHWVETEERVLCAIALHCGGDVRGNYELPVVYEFDSMEDLYHVFNWYVGLDNKDVDMYSSGYTNEPQYKFYRDYDLVTVDYDKVQIVAKNKETGVEEVFYPEHPINFL